jgi:hypothetical protein
MDKQPVVTKDMWTIVALRVCGHVPEKIDIQPHPTNEDTKYLVYHFGDEAYVDYDDFMRGVNREPFNTLRTVMRAVSEFKNNLFRLL